MLTGGGAGNVSLEPLSFETNSGLGVSAGGLYLFLEPAPEAEPRIPPPTPGKDGNETEEPAK